MPQPDRQIDSTIDVVTPENISFQYELAGPFRRLPAFLTDLAVRFGIWIITLIVISLSGAFTGMGDVALALWLLLWFVLEWFYGGLLETFWNGQTIGKRLLGMRVLRTDGQPINGLQAVMRNVLRMVDLMPLVPLAGMETPQGVLPVCLIGLVTPMVTRRYQRLGDLVCGTMVVVEERKWLATVARVEDPQVVRFAAELPATFQVTHKLSKALAAYVERRKYLSAERRLEIARHLGSLLTPRLELPEDTNHDLLLCALYYRTFVARQSSKDDSMRGAGTLPPPVSPAEGAVAAPAVT